MTEFDLTSPSNQNIFSFIAGTRHALLFLSVLPAGHIEKRKRESNKRNKIIRQLLVFRKKISWNLLYRKLIGWLVFNL